MKDERGTMNDEGRMMKTGRMSGLSFIIHYSSFIVLFLCCLAAASEAHRFESRWTEADGEHTAHGTAFILGGVVYTAAHNVERGEAFIEFDTSWIRCDVKERDESRDVATLKPRFHLDDDTPADGCHASIEGRPVKRLRVENLKLDWCEIAGFGQGGSGAPIYSHGKLVGMAVAWDGEKRVRWTEVKSQK